MLEKLATDTDMDVKYFAQEAISGKVFHLLSLCKKTLNDVSRILHVRYLCINELCSSLLFTVLALA